MKPHPFVCALEKAFHDASNPEIAAKQSAYMRHQFRFHGIQRALRDKLQRDLFKNHAPASEQELILILKELWAREEREFQYAACDLALNMRKIWTPKLFRTFETMIRKKAWWDTVDDVAANLVGTLLHKHPELIETMDQWIQDQDLWIRRTAIIFQLFWKEMTDEKRLFSYCEKTTHEKDFFIRKAIGWALRQYSKTAPQAVRKFIHKHHDSLSGLSIREGSKYL